MFGGIETKETQENEYQIRIEDIDSTVRIPVTVNDQDKFCNYVPRLNNSRFTHILGHLDDSLVAVQTQLGRILIGHCQGRSLRAFSSLSCSSKVNISERKVGRSRNKGFRFNQIK